MSMKHVLCFGDSNTWGYVPGTEGERFFFADRYPGILQGLLGVGVRVHEAGLNGRMTGWDDPLSPDRNALSQIAFVLETHRPLDAIVIMLGTNDLKRHMNLEAADCALALETLIERIDAAGCGRNSRNGSRPSILVIAPPWVVETPTPFGSKFDGAIPKSRDFAAAYADVAKRHGCEFLDAGTLVETSTRDGVHLDKPAHRRLAEVVWGVLVRTMEPG